MDYKSKFKMALMKQEMELKEKEMEISEVVAKRTEITKKIEKEEEKVSLLRSKLNEGGVIDAAFFATGIDNGYNMKLKEQLEKVETELRLKRLEYERMMKKKETIVEIDKREEKKFYDELKRKQQKKLIGQKIILKIKESRGE